MRALFLLIAILIAAPAWAQDASPFALCETAINNAQQAQALPPGLLPAIAQVESGRFDPLTGRTRSWPWTIDANGSGQMFENKAQAIAAVHALQAQGIRSIDVGCLQVNLLHHPFAFASLEDAFDPATNAAYAARFLRALYGESGNWPVAAAGYHSRTPALGADYATLVMAIWHGSGAVTRETLQAAARWQHRFAAAPPPPHPFAPPPLAGVPADPPVTGTVLAELLSPDCAVPRTAAEWLLPSHAPGCGRSVFASTTGLQRALAAIPAKAATQPPWARLVR